MAEGDNIPAWTLRGGSFRHSSTPMNWVKKKSGQWNRRDLVPYGKVNAEYRRKYFVCPECQNELVPLEREYRFGCLECKLVFGWGFSSLYGFGKGHERAEYIQS
ncbi:MAG: hypothetical protein AAB294_02510 [Pseudomonadota bacterium]